MPDEAPHPLALRRFVPLALLVLAGMLFFTLEGHRYLSVAALAEHRQRLGVGLVRVFPLWLVNRAAGAVGLRLWVYILATFFGMAPTSFIYASLGNGLGEVLAQGHHPDLAVLFQPSVLLPILGLAALALLPVLYKRRRGKEPAKAHR